MDERVSSWRMIFAVACVLLMLACVPPDRLFDLFGYSSRTYDAAEPACEMQSSPPASETLPQSREEGRKEEVAIRPTVRLASRNVPRPHEVGTVPFVREARSHNVFRLVSEIRRIDDRPIVEHTPAAQKTKRIAAVPAVNSEPAEETIAASTDVSDSPAAGADLVKAKPVVLGPPPRIVRRRSYAELLKQFSSDSPDVRPEEANRVITLPSPPSDEVRCPSWIEPSALLAALDQRKQAEWASIAARLVRQLGSTGSEHFAASLAALRQIDRQAAAATDAAPVEERGATRSLVAALGRRVDLWIALYEAGWPARNVESPPVPDRRNLAATATRVDRWLRNIPNRTEWIVFLSLDEIGRLAGNAETEDDAIRESARRVLGRLIDTPWTAEEEATLAAEPFGPYIAALRAWAAERVDFGRLLKTIEQFETAANHSNARRLAQTIRTLQMSPSPSTRAVGETLNRNYRNANFLARVRTEFLNRFVPQREAEYEWVRDVILGQPVQGNARTESIVHFRAVPAEDRIRLALEVEGRISSLTSADAGAAVLFNNSRSNYVARKQITLNAEGLTYQPSTAQVYSETRLRGLRTALDPIPLVGSLMQDMVLSQHRQQKPYVRRELQRKVAAKARLRVDKEANPRLDRLSNKYHDEVLSRLAKLGIIPELRDAETTEHGFIAAVRLAASDQLAAYGPPPVLDSDAEAAVWIHETAMNNLLARMPFNGKTFSAAELVKAITGDDESADASISQKHGDVRVTFAPARAVQVAFDGDVIEVTLAIRELEKPPKKWHNFFVCARLKPTLEGKQIKLARTGVVGLYGRRFRIQSQLALRGIFSKVFDDDRPFEIMPESISEDERLAELRIAAFTVRSGWIVFALDGEPIRVAEEPGPGSPVLR